MPGMQARFTLRVCLAGFHRHEVFSFEDTPGAAAFHLVVELAAFGPLGRLQGLHAVRQPVGD
jgi:hypothetical protein